MRVGLIYTNLEWEKILDHITWVEELGFDSVWLTEHHFQQFSPSPLTLAAAVAARTERVRIATNVLLAPLYNPVRLAEEAAMVSVLSHGRFDLGIGMGYYEREFAGLLVNIRHRPSLFEETVEILRRAWRGETFSFEGKRYSIPEITVTPVPDPPPRILIGAVAEPAIKRAARLGDGYLGAYNAHLRMYVDELKALGKTGTVCAGQQATIAPDVEKAKVELREYALRYVNDHIDRGLFPGPHYDDLGAAIDAGHYLLLDGPTAVAAIAAVVEEFPLIEDVHFMVTAGPGETFEHARERVEYIASQVAPALRQLGVEGCGGGPIARQRSAR
jgi:alkanesulfonate monooxygenase SsuD/methylene tetrahydromethanopterin reductase-like flavin-dependent oxidoreductase (luciferase family)